MNGKFYDLKGYKVKAIQCRYYYGKGLGISLITNKNEPFATMTVNLDDDVCGDKPHNKDLAYVDTNNCSWAEKFIQENNLGKKTGEFGYSGFCIYPLYKFYLDKIEKE